jgi:hypothetical protein
MSKIDNQVDMKDGEMGQEGGAAKGEFRQMIEKIKALSYLVVCIHVLNFWKEPISGTLTSDALSNILRIASLGAKQNQDATLLGHLGL